MITAVPTFTYQAAASSSIMYILHKKELLAVSRIDTDGQSLLVNVSGVLTEVHLNGAQQMLPMTDVVLQLFQWDSVNNTALLLVRHNGASQFVEYDLTHATSREITDKSIKWAAKSADGRLIYIDSLDQFWQPGPLRPQRMTALDNQGDRSNSFVIHDHTIYAINIKHKLWSYDLKSGSFTVLGEVRENIDYLTDGNHADVLMSLQVAAKKEVVELTLNK